VTKMVPLSLTRRTVMTGRLSMSSVTVANSLDHGWRMPARKGLGPQNRNRFVIDISKRKLS
jgi:hypothetical protein